MQLTFERGPLLGEVAVAGDKSISHRALILGAVSPGVTRVRGLNAGDDVAATRDALAAMGASIVTQESHLVIQGGFLHNPAGTIDAKNSGTTARLLMGLCAGRGIDARFDGDASLRKRPMERVAKPLRSIGAAVETTDGRLPAFVQGIEQPPGATFALELPSAQVKSALLLAHLNARGPVTVTGDNGSRDHTERMLRAFGRDLSFDASSVTLQPGALQGCDVEVPGDLSAAAFFFVAAAITPGSDVTVRGAGVNPTRSGVIDVLLAMGANLEFQNEREVAGEPIADIRVRYAPLHATTIAGTLVVRAIDEIVVLAVAAAHAAGVTRVRDARELRHKESDRLSAVTALLRSNGVGVVERDDGFEITGGVEAPDSRAAVVTHGDHRIAMAAAALAAASGPLGVDDATCLAVSYPSFARDLARLQKEPSRPST